VQMKKVLVAGILLLVTCLVSAKGAYMTSSEFLEKAFGSEAPKIQTIWIKEELKKVVHKITLGSLKKLRVKYWVKDDRTAWILEEVGKELPITIGVVIENDEIVNLEILTFRESRGGEVRYPSFTNQFSSLRLEKDHSLNKHIDGVTGATLSVRAVKKVARLALYLHSRTPAAS